LQKWDWGEVECTVIIAKIRSFGQTLHKYMGFPFSTRITSLEDFYRAKENYENAQQQSNMDYVEVFQKSWYEHDKKNLEYGKTLQNVNPHRKKWKGECKLTKEALHQMIAGGHIC
jgi:hypothetical protein